MSCRTRRVVLAALAVVLTALPALAAKEKGRTSDIVTIVPDYAAYNVRSIAMLPIATYDGNLTAQRTVDSRLGAKLKETGYRWVAGITARTILTSALGDSTMKLVGAEVLANARVDSLRAPLVCARLRTDAVLAVRVDQWEQQQILWNQSGRPNTTIRLRASLVDSTGTLLWSTSSSETVQGLYHTPDANPLGVSATSLESKPITGEGGPPSFEDVLERILIRWQAVFPPFAAPAAPAK